MAKSELSQSILICFSQLYKFAFEIVKQKTQQVRSTLIPLLTNVLWQISNLHLKNNITTFCHSYKYFLFLNCQQFYCYILLLTLQWNSKTYRETTKNSARVLVFANTSRDTKWSNQSKCDGQPKRRPAFI